jgi:hypothetical protein
MAMKLKTFEYTILDGELLPCSKEIVIDLDKTDIVGIRKGSVLSGVQYIEKTALFIVFNDHSYGNEAINTSDFIDTSNQCCGAKDAGSQDFDDTDFNDDFN